MSGKRNLFFRKKKNHAGSQDSGKSSEKVRSGAQQKPMSVDEQLAVLGPLLYNGGKAKNFQLYKKLKDLQLKERFGEHGEFISTGILYKPDAPKGPVRSKDIKPRRNEGSEDEDDDEDNNENEYEDAEEDDNSSKSKPKKASSSSQETIAMSKKGKSSKKAIVITRKGRAIASGDDDDDNDSSEDEDDWSDPDDEDQGPRDGYYRGVKCYSRREYKRETAIYNERLKLYIKKCEEARGIHVKIISNLEQSISEASREKIKEKDEYERINKSKNPLAYWKLIVQIHQSIDSGDVQLDDYNTDKDYRGIRQHPNELITVYYARYLEALRTAENAEDPVEYSEKRKATHFIDSLNEKYTAFRVLQVNNSTSLVQRYASTLAEAYDRASSWMTTNSLYMTGYDFAFTTKSYEKDKKDKKIKPKKGGDSKDNKGIKGQDGKQTNSEKYRGKDGVLRSRKGAIIDCNVCGGNHFEKDCSDLKDIVEDSLKASSKKTEETFVTVDKVLSTYHEYRLDKWSLLCDTETTVSIISNDELVFNVRPASVVSEVTGYGGGTRDINLEASTARFGEVKYDPQGSFNLLKFADIADMHTVEWYQAPKGSADRHYFEVQCDDGAYYRFNALRNGMFVCQLDTDDYFDPNNPRDIALSTVMDNKRKFSARQVKQADQAVELQERLGWASASDVIKMIKNSSFLSSPNLSHADFARAINIYGPNVATTKGKTRAMPTKSHVYEYIERTILASQVIHIDVFYVSSITFLAAVADPIMYTISELLKTRTAKSLMEVILLIIRYLQKNTIVVRAIISDREGALNKLDSAISSLGIQLVLRTGRHDPLVERKIETIKGKVRSCIHSQPYRVPKFMLILMVCFITYCINLVPTRGTNGVHSPRENLTGKKLGPLDIPTIFGRYYEVTVANTDNSMEERTNSCIAMGIDRRGEPRFYKLATGGFVHRISQYTLFPTPQNVIDHMNKIADQPRQQVSANPQWEIGLGRQRRMVNEVDEDVLPQGLMPKAHYPVPEARDYSSIASQRMDLEQTGVTPVNITPTEVIHPDDIYMEPSPNIVDDIIVDDSVPVTDNDVHHVDHLETIDDSSPVLDNEIGSNPNDPLLQSPILDELNDVKASHGYNLRPRKKNMVMQIGYNKAKKLFGKEATISYAKEQYNLHQAKCISPVRWDSLNYQQKKKVLRAMTFFKEKKDSRGVFEKLKGRSVADGSKQDRSLYEDTASPTASTPAVFLNLMIAAREKRVVKVVDIPGAFLKADMIGEEVHVIFDKVGSAILCVIDPIYSSYLRDDGCLTCKVDKALYGLVESAKLWYNTLKDKLESYGYVGNPKDLCVFNKEVDGEQVTVTFHVDDLLITSVNENGIDDLINKLSIDFECELKPSTGPIISYLGMTIDFTNDKYVEVRMERCIDELISASDMHKEYSSPAGEKLFDVGDGTKLDSDKCKLFHSLVAKSLYISKRGRPDISVAVNFLTRRVLCPTTVDWKKLERVIGYLKRTRVMGLRLNSLEDLCVFGYADASFAVHSDYKSQSGVFITCGQGALYVKSTVQKLNTKSSSEAELVAVSDGAGQILWTRDFLIFQGYDLGPAIVYQDNMSTISLIKRGNPASEKTRHINIRYFFIKDRVDTGELKIEYMCTNDMVADILTKPLQGEKFNKLRDYLLGIVVC